MGLQQKAIAGAAWAAVQNWGSQFGALIVFLVLARLLTPEDFGLVALANVFLAFVQVFLNQGFPQALIQRKNLEPEHIDTAFWTNIAVGVVLAIAGMIAAPWVSAAFDRTALTPILRWFSLLLVVSSLVDVQQALLERAFAYRYLAVRSLLGLLISGVVGITLALSGAGVWSLVAQQLIYETVGMLVLWRASDWRPQFRFSIRHFQDLFKFGRSILAFNVLGFVNSRSDDLLIGYFLGPTALGFYSLAYRILSVMTQVLIETSERVALPTFSRMQHNLSQMRSAFYKVARFTSLLAFPFFLGIAVLAPKVVPFVFGSQWMASVPVLQVLAIVGIFRALSRFKGAVFMAVGQPEWKVKLGLIASSLNFVGFAIAVRWGIVAVSGAYLVRALIMFPIVQLVLNRLIQVSIGQYLRQAIAPLAASLTMSGVLLALGRSLEQLDIRLQLIVLILAGSGVYLLALQVLAPHVIQEVISTAQSTFPKLNLKILSKRL
ncbi:MAG: lipopolysaccharide biosynthesis protein [Cyanobacteria bacterium J06629_19]